MNRLTLIGIIISIVVVITGVFFLIKMSNNVDSSGNFLVQEVQPKSQEVVKSYTYSSKGFDPLLEVMSLNELENNLLELEHIFMNFLPSVIEVSVNNDSYYHVNSDEILAIVGLSDVESFSKLIAKMKRIPDYNQCHVSLIENTLIIDEDYYQYDIRVVFDGSTEMDYHVSLDRDNLKIIIE